MDVVNFLLQYKFILLFYLVVILFLIFNRKRVEIQNKIIVLYRMKWGLRWMDTVSSKYRQWVILLGYIGVGAGYIGLIFISYILVKNLVDLIRTPEAVSGVSLVLPGVNVPGLGILPFWYWLLAIFVIAIVHEFSHGIVARAHKVEVKNTGIVLFGPIIGAFVEPNEPKLRQEKDITQYSILAAGSFSNILLAIVSVALLSLVFSPLVQAMVTPTGFTFDNYYDGEYPFQQNKIAPGTVITGIDGKDIVKFEEFADVLQKHEAGDTVTLATNAGDYTITLAPNPDDATKPFLGIQEIHNEFEVQERYDSGIWKGLYYVVDWFAGFFRWLFLLSLGIGLFNLLPLPIVDGGRMAQVFLHKLKGPEVGEKRYRQISLFFLLVLILNLIYPLFGKLF